MFRTWFPIMGTKATQARQRMTPLMQQAYAGNASGDGWAISKPCWFTWWSTC
jgi:hypothetical protein